ncbi:hypothetical protein [uncultured Desulfosarcina sp.]|uniref:hypothetical protein n=1 Tax=uncultured Desulfosarcina sp. TaxID=218289 RepID=UPI0029C940EB|nr:hypothetical protein [uncultured Desulfosarcina sp.]
MKSITLSILLICAILVASPSAAGSDTDNTADHPPTWSRFWQGIADDWRKIGKDAKESGTEAGRTVKEEFQKIPENFSKGIESAKEDFKNGTGSTIEPRRENGK